MSKKSNWVPRASGIAWTKQQMLDKRSPYGPDSTLWGVPANRSIYLVDRVQRLVTHVDGPEKWPNGDDLYQQLNTVLAILHYRLQRLPAGCVFPADLRKSFWDAYDDGGVQPEVTEEM